MRTQVIDGFRVETPSRELCARDAVIWWDLKWREISVRQIGQGDDPRFVFSRGACNIFWRDARPDEHTVFLLRLFVDLVGFYGLPPRAVLHAFEVIPEFRQPRNE